MGFESIYHWDDPVKSGVIFGTVLITLLSICYFSLISVLAYLSLAVLFTVVAIKLYVYVMVTFLKKDTPNPLAKLSDVKCSISTEKVEELAKKTTEKANCCMAALRRLFLVENMLDSIKFGFSLWALTYIGSWFNAMTLVILAWVSLFTCPKIYVNHKAQIDCVLDKVKLKLNEIQDKVGSVMPQSKASPPVKKED